MRIITLNLNGIRSAWNKGLLPWLEAQQADVVCLQEIKAQQADLTAEMQCPDGLHAYYHCAEKKGYSGVGLWCRKKPDRVIEGMGHGEFDTEGRFIRADFGKLSVVSLYLPSGSSSPERQEAKFRFMDYFLPLLASMAAEGRDVVVCGDWNIAHQQIDLKNWKSNQKNSGFLPEERAWMSCVLNEAGLGRRLPSTAPGHHRGLLHVVVESGAGLGEERRLAPRLSAGHAVDRRHGGQRLGMEGFTLLRSRSLEHRFRLCALIA
jgi:exodeoxyribonuclease-3